jgi:hypothetical protein
MKKEGQGVQGEVGKCNPSAWPMHNKSPDTDSLQSPENDSPKTARSGE